MEQDTNLGAQKLRLYLTKREWSYDDLCAALGAKIKTHTLRHLCGGRQLATRQQAILLRDFTEGWISCDDWDAPAVDDLDERPESQPQTSAQ